MEDHIQEQHMMYQSVRFKLDKLHIVLSIFILALLTSGAYLLGRSDLENSQQPHMISPTKARVRVTESPVNLMSCVTDKDCPIIGNTDRYCPENVPACDNNIYAPCVNGYCQIDELQPTPIQKNLHDSIRQPSPDSSCRTDADCPEMTCEDKRCMKPYCINGECHNIFPAIVEGCKNSGGILRYLDGCGDACGQSALTGCGGASYWQCDCGENACWDSENHSCLYSMEAGLGS